MGKVHDYWGNRPGMQRGQTLKPLTKTREYGLVRKNWPWSRGTGHKICHVLGKAAKFIVQGRKALQLLSMRTLEQMCAECTKILGWANQLCSENSPSKRDQLKKREGTRYSTTVFRVVWTSCCTRRLGCFVLLLTMQKFLSSRSTENVVGAVSLYVPNQPLEQ